MAANEASNIQAKNHQHSTQLHQYAFQVNIGPAPLLWELGNDAVRPLIYFLTNPAVWDGLQVMCCKSKHQLVNQEDEEIEVPLSPVTSV